MTTITALPTAPDRADPTTFDTRADAWAAALGTWTTEANTVAGEVNTNASTASTAATTATTQAGTATTQAGIATAAAGTATTDASTASAAAIAAAASAAAAAGTAAFVDTDPIVKGSADATKRVRFEVDGLTTATTRVITVPDADITLVGVASTQTLANKTIEAGVFSNGYTEETVTANTSTAYTIDLANGSVQILTLTGNCTYTFPANTAGKSFLLVQKQDATGSRTVTWDADVKWPSSTAPTITGTASKADVFAFSCDGTYWYGRVIGQNYL